MSKRLIDRLGIQSWCFRSMKSHTEVIDALRACRVQRLEISNAHVHPLKSNATAVREEYQRAGIIISSAGAFTLGGDEHEAEQVFRFMRGLGLSSFAAALRPDGVAIAQRMAERYGMHVALHNHGRNHWHGPSWALDQILAKTSSVIGLCLDTAWALDAGDDPVEMVRRYADRLYGVHIKDFVFDRSGKPQDVIVGQGNLDLPGLLRALEEVEFSGFLTLEYEGEMADPIPGTQKCVAAVHQAYAEISQ